MDPENWKVASDYLYFIINESGVLRLKYLLKLIKEDYGNPSFDYLQKRCRNVADLAEFLKQYPYLFIVENGKVATCSDELESGQENADKYFEEKLKAYKERVRLLKFRQHIEEAPEDVKIFISKFYPDIEFKRYLQKRPHIFITHKDSTVDLIEREAVLFFRKMLEYSGEVRFTSLRGRIGQAPDYIRVYINNHYPETEFLQFLENNQNVFEVNSNGDVRLVR